MEELKLEKHIVEEIKILCNLVINEERYNNFIDKHIAKGILKNLRKKKDATT